MPIRILPQEISSQIAAGEVVERPASVVKELIENALDAEAKSVSVAIAEAGRALIEVADDGCGIPSDEITLAVARYATSKISRAEDLFHIETLGFRGEALASIASVSRMTITSRTADSAVGIRLHVEGGQVGPLDKVASPIGTVVQIKDLFYNVPVRLKFLKQNVTERHAINALITRYMLAYPDVRFKIIEGKTMSLQTAGDGNQRAILSTLFGVDTARQMLEIMATEGELQISGFISPTSLTRSNRKEITLFLNGRWIQNLSLSTSLLRAYHTLLMVGRYPLAIIFIKTPPEEVDVNVHPTKAEVRFKNPDRIFSFMQRTVRRALLSYLPVSQAVPQALWRTNTLATDLGWQIAHTTSLNSGDDKKVPYNKQDGKAVIPDSNITDLQSSLPRIPLLRLIGQVGTTYLVAEGPDGLYLIDQHAAHERILFEQYMTQHECKSTPSQVLLTPTIVNFPPEQAILLNEYLPVLKEFGFHVESFGSNSFQIRAIPTLFGGSDPTAALRATVEDFEEDEKPLETKKEALLVARVCKRMAIKAGQVLSADEQSALLIDLESCTTPRTCPHGRPTMIHLSVDMLERQFGRRGAR